MTSRRRALPSHHVARPRLVERVLASTVCLLEAGGGSGKSTLAAEAGETLGAVVVEVVLTEPGTTQAALVRRVEGALRRAGLSDAALALEGVTDAEDAVDALVDALEAQVDPVVVVVEEVHRAAHDAAELLALAARSMRVPHHLVACGRRLPGPLAALEAAGSACRLDGTDLAFDVDEVAALCRDLPPSGAAALQRITEGWAAPLVVAALRLNRAHDPAALAAELVAGPGLLASLVRSQLAELGPADRASAVQLAHLPVVDLEVAELVGGHGLLDRLAEAGMSLAGRTGGAADVSGPVREILAGLAPLDPSVAERVAGLHVGRAEVLVGLRLLLAVGDPGAAARSLSALPPAAADGLEAAELAGVVGAFPDEAVAAAPGVLVHLARALATAGRKADRDRALRRAAALAGDPALRREVDAELAFDLALDQRVDEAEALLHPALVAVGAGELRTRARLLEALGLALSYDQARFDEADEAFSEAARLFRSVGEPAAAAGTLQRQAYQLHYVHGHLARSVQTADAALGLLVGRSRQRASALVFRGEVLVGCGRYEEAEVDLAQARALAAPLRDHRTLAYVAWTLASAASQRGDLARTLAELAEVDRHRADWFSGHMTGVVFLADAAVMLDRLGQRAAAAAYLAHARTRRAETEVSVVLAEAAMDARAGDAAAALAALDGLDVVHEVEPREHWRIELLRAAAAARLGRAEVAAAATASAFSLAAELGLPALPRLRERDLAEALQGSAGLDARAAARAEPDPAAHVAVLGRFEVRRAGRTLRPPSGRAADALKLVVVAGGRAPLDEVVEGLWPEGDPEVGRTRLRNVLNRLRAEVGDFVVREGEVLALAPGTEVDAVAFEADAAAALAGLATDRPAAVARARSAVARYAGDLLPEDLYASWAAGRREQLRRRVLALLDVLVDDSEAAGDVDEALRLLERGIDLDPFDDGRHLRAARLLVDHGRRGAASVMLGRAAAALEELGLRPSARHRELVAELS